MDFQQNLDNFTYEVINQVNEEKEIMNEIANFLKIYKTIFLKFSMRYTKIISQLFKLLERRKSKDPLTNLILGFIYLNKLTHDILWPISNNEDISTQILKFSQEYTELLMKEIDKTYLIFSKFSESKKEMEAMKQKYESSKNKILEIENQIFLNCASQKNETSNSKNESYLK